MKYKNYIYIFAIASIIICPFLTYAQSQRQIVLDELSKRPDDPWPRGDGHVVLGEPGSPLSQKGYHEPGGSFSPSPGSFGMSIWVLDSTNKLIVTSDDIPMEKIIQHYTFLTNNKIPSIVTQTPYYNCIWSYVDLGKWELKVTDANKNGTHICLVSRSVGPAGGPIESIIWDQSRLLVNHRWIITPSVTPGLISIGDEKKGDLLKTPGENQSVISTDGWGFAKLEFSNSSMVIKINDTKPVFSSPLYYEKSVVQFKTSLPDPEFMECMNGQVANLMMGYIGTQTGPGEPVNYPLAWERDGAYSLTAIARSGNIKTAKDLSVYFAENDFFGGFGAEGDAPGSEINALTEIALLLDDPEYYQWVWPHIQRKLGYIDEMLNSKENTYKNYIGPLVPYLVKQNDLKRRGQISRVSEDGLVAGSMDLHFPALYITAISYRGLMQASRLALKVNQPEVSRQCIEKATKIKAAWHRNFGKPEYDEERNFMISVWPSWITNKDNKLFVDKIKEHHDTIWKNSVPAERPLWSYFTASEAHQWLFLNQPDKTWDILSYFWDNQCSPGLYSFWEGNGEENSFHGWDNYRGWLKPKYVTPHYWTASEMLLLQLDMLAYYDESGSEPELVIGGGIPKAWMDKKMSVENYKTKFGTISWYYDLNSLKVEVKGAKSKFKVQPGVNFNQNVKINVEFK